MRFHRRVRAPLAVAAAGATLVGLVQSGAWAEGSGAANTAPAAARPADAAQIAPGERTAVLGKDWRSSDDRAWTTTSDAQGFHVLTARKKDGYAWQTAASLSEPGFDADMWIGNACVTGSGKRAVVVYAPRTFTNDPQLMARGGFTAVVELDTGKVTKLDLQASLSYYNPGCGTDETAVLTQSGGQDMTGTRLVRVDTETGRLDRAISAKGQVTSAVPVAGGGVVAADGARLVTIDTRGRSTELARTDGVPYHLTPDSAGGVVFLDSAPGKAGGTVRVKRLAIAATQGAARTQGRPAVLAEGPVGGAGLTTGAGSVYVTGQSRLTAKLPATVRQLPGTPKDTAVTTRGEAVLTATGWADGKDSRLQPQDADKARPVSIAMTVNGTGRNAAFTVDPTLRQSAHAAEGRTASPRLLAPRGTGGTRAKGTAAKGTAKTVAPSAKSALAVAAAGDPTNPVEQERTCSVPRNDPRNQAMQPKPRQVEWAVDQAVTGYLNSRVSRPANWKNLGMPAYLPQSLFLNPPVDGGGRVPAQVMLGVTAQESNMWQAARTVVPGVTGNPLIGNYYGINLYDGNTANDWDIDWSKADCGYGITQVTDHMRLAGREDGHGGAAWPYQTQRAVALDYTANVAAGLQILVAKWNETRAAGLTLNDGAPSRIENWYYALWAYNSGFHPQSEAAANGGAWGLGWANNPANPEWDAGRLPFMENAAGGEDASAAAHPQFWPYPEKVLGFAGHPPAYLESPGKMVPAFRASWWNGTAAAVSVKGSALYNRAHVKPPEDLFCDASNSCDPTKISDAADNSSAVSGPCGRADSKCWWNKPATWKTDCSYSCGNEFMRFDSTYPEEADGTAYPPNCGNSGLPAGALIVDDVPTDVPSIRPNCPKYWDSLGTFTLDYGQGGAAGLYPGKADTHQLGAGFGGHFYFSHTRPNDAKGQKLAVTGKWKLASSIKGEAQVMVHLPDHGAQTPSARYEIDTSLGTVSRTISQAGNSNRWVSLGAYRFDNAPEVRLSTITPDATGEQDIAFDAVAFVPGDYDGMPDISFPDADESVPDDVDVPDVPVAIDQKAPGTFATTPRTAAPTTLPADSCRPVAGKPNSEVCITFTPAKDGPAPKTPAPKLPAAKGVTPRIGGADEPDGPPTCSISPLAQSFTRFDACIKGTATLVLLVNKVPAGTAVFNWNQTIQLLVNSSQIVQKITLTPLSFQGEVAEAAPNVQFFCGTGCQMDGPTTTGVPLWVPGDKHSVTITARGNWKETPTPSSSTFGLNWIFSGQINGIPTTSTDLFQPQLQVRCDNMFAGKKAGCVFKNFTPVFSVNTKKFPAAAALYWVLMQKLVTHPGSQKYNKPLHRLEDPVAQQANRNILCKLAVAKWVNHPSTPDSSCDEYPFAASRESGGQTITSGTECAQLYATKVGTKWQLFDDERSQPPTWNEVCGRGSIPIKQNTGAGGQLGRWTPKVRLFDNDAYFVDTPGFENCDPATVCQVSPR